MEHLFYEARPWAFTLLGIYCILSPNEHSTMMVASGALLTFASTMIILARSRNRAGR